MLILFDAENELETFIDFSWEQSFDQNLDDIVFYDLIVTNTVDNEIVFSTTTENLNFVIPVYILYNDEDQPIDERTYRWIVIATDDSGITPPMECNVPYTFTLLFDPLSVDDLLIPDNYALGQSYPNPFNPVTYIDYAIPENDYINLSVYDINGKLVETLDSGNKLAGYYTISWNASNTPSGTYFIRFSSKNYNATRKVSLLK